MAGWPLVHEGDFEMSASVKSLFDLKMMAISVDAPHMVRRARGDRSRGAPYKQRLHQLTVAMSAS